MNPLPSLRRGLSRLLAVAGITALIALPTFGGGGATGTGYVAFGTVEDFGSVFVNGIEFFTTGANVVIDGVPGQPESSLRIGMPVRVEGTVRPAGTTGDAVRVEYASDVRGAADGVALATADGALVRVNGIALRMDEFTVFDGLLGPGAIAAGDRLVASGLRDDGSGEIYATYVARAAAVGTVTTGVASSVGPSSFVVGSLLVTFDVGSVPGLADGRVVRVRSLADPVGGTLVADDVTVVSGALGVVAGSPGSAEGIVANRTLNGFTLGGLVVRITRDTKFKNGAAPSLANGTLVETEGTIQADGSLAALTVSLPKPDSASLQAVVVSKDATGFRLLSADGVRVEVTSQTKFKDRRSARVGGFDWKLLKVGDTVNAAGQEVADATILAMNVDLVDASAPVVAKARARALAAPSAVVVGLRATAGAGTAFVDAGGASLSAEAFFAKAVGRRVKATGSATGAAALAVARFEIEQ
jgi:hypothetical protein